MSFFELVAFKRVMQFRAGPNEHTFHACRQHLPDLEAGDVELFFTTADQPVESVSEFEGQDEECYFCRGEHGP